MTKKTTATAQEISDFGLDPEQGGCYYLGKVVGTMSNGKKIIEVRSLDEPKATDTQAVVGESVLLNADFEVVAVKGKHPKTSSSKGCIKRIDM